MLRMVEGIAVTDERLGRPALARSMEIEDPGVREALRGISLTVLGEGEPL